MSSPIATTLLNLRDEIERANNQLKKAQGTKIHIQSQLKKMGYKNLKEAKNGRNTVSQERKKLLNEIQDLIDKIGENYDI